MPHITGVDQPRLRTVGLQDRGVEQLFQIITEREECASIAIATNLPFSEWGPVFPDPRLVAAIVDRVTFNAHIFETGTQSYRRRTRKDTRRRANSPGGPVHVGGLHRETTTGFLPTDYTAVVLADADPSGEETPGLLTDVGTYLPAIEQWLDLATLDVTQSLTIEKAVVPGSLAAALEQARGQLRPGTTAVTITGTRQRSGVWDGEPAKTSYDVAFTVFVACRPAFELCHVLRLSQLDNPLR